MPEDSSGRVRTGWRRRPSGPVSALVVVLLVALLFFVHLSRPLWFFGDDWDFLVDRKLSDPGTLLRPHSEHWSTVPIVVFRVMYAIFGLHHYLPYALMPIFVHLAIVVLVFVVLRRHGVGAWTSVGIVTFLAFLGASGENVLWDFQIGFMGPVLFGLVAVLLLDRDTDRVRAPLVWVVLVLALATSGTGLTVLAWIGAYTLMRHGWRRALAVVVVPVVVYLVWYAAYGNGAEPPGRGPLLQVLEATVRGIARPWQSILTLPGSGVVVLSLLVLAVVGLQVPERLRALAVSALFALLPFYFLIAYSRVALAGVDAGSADRYTYVGIVLTLPALGVLLSGVVRHAVVPPVMLRTAGAGLFVVLLLLGISQVMQFQAGRVQLIGDDERFTVASARLVESGAQLLSTTPDAVYNPNLTVTQLEQRGFLDALPSIAVGAQARVDAAGSLQTGVATTRLPVPDATDVRVYGPPGTTAGLPADELGSVRVKGCVVGYVPRRGAAYVVLRTGAEGAQVSVSVNADLFTTQLVRGGVTSTQLPHTVEQRGASWVGTTVTNARFRIVLPAGTFSVCTGGAVAAS